MGGGEDRDTHTSPQGPPALPPPITEEILQEVRRVQWRVPSAPKNDNVTALGSAGLCGANETSRRLGPARVAWRGRAGGARGASPLGGKGAVLACFDARRASMGLVVQGRGLCSHNEP